MRLSRRAIMLACAAACLPLPRGANAADKWPEKPVTFVNPFNAGGSADRIARAIATYMTHELGVPINVVNKPGAGGQLGATYFLAQPDDGYTVFATSMSPYLANNILLTNAKFKMGDFGYINSSWTDWDIIAVHMDRPHKTLVELLNDIKANPGKISASVVFGSSGQVVTLALLDAAKIPPNNLKLVFYEGGAPARAAVAGGQVDFTVLGGEGSEGIRDFIRPLAVMLEQPDKDWPAPPVNEALKPLGIKMPVITGAMRGLVVHASFKQKHPDRYAKLVDAYKRTTDREDFKKFVAAGAMGNDWLGPEKTTQVVMENFEILQKYKDLLKK